MYKVFCINDLPAFVHLTSFNAYLDKTFRLCGQAKYFPISVASMKNGRKRERDETAIC